MKLLALDSSGLVASVAVLEDDSLLAEYTVNYKKTHSQTLLPMLDTVAQMIELNLNDLDAIAIGPDCWNFHSPSEQVSVSSTQRVYDLLRGILTECRV